MYLHQVCVCVSNQRLLVTSFKAIANQSSYHILQSIPWYIPFIYPYTLPTLVEIMSSLLVDCFENISKRGFWGHLSPYFERKKWKKLPNIFLYLVWVGRRQYRRVHLFYVQVNISLIAKFCSTFSWIISTLATSQSC